MFDLTARIIKSAHISSALTSNPDLTCVINEDAWNSYAIVRYPSNLVNAATSARLASLVHLTTDAGDRDT